MSAVRQNWYSIASIYFPENRNPCLIAFTRIKKQQEVIGKIGEDLKLTRTFEQAKANPANLWARRHTVFS